jgi:hemerythrin
MPELSPEIGGKMHIAWNECLISGNTTIDSQHQELFTHINSFFNSIDKEFNHETTVRTLNYLVKYVRFHFGTEEELMESSDYQELKVHKAAHRKLVDSLMVCYKKLIAEGNAMCVKDELTELLQVWFVDHIMTYDQRLAAFLKYNG